MKSVICAVGALSIALASTAFAQDLGALAAKERERRKEQAKAHPTPARVVTDDDMTGAARRRAIDTGESADSERPAATSTATPSQSGVSIEEAAEKLREVLTENRQEQLADRLRSELRFADAAVRAAETALQREKERHDKISAFAGEKPFEARHRAEVYVDQAQKTLDAAKDRVRAIEDEAQQAGLDPTRLH
jgi:hypothetical protein